MAAPDAADMVSATGGRGFMARSLESRLMLMFAAAVWCLRRRRTA